MSDSISSPLNLSIAKKSATKSSQGKGIKVNDHKSPSATPKIALLLPQKPLVPEKLLRRSQKRKYQQNLEPLGKQETQQRSQIQQLPPILQPHAAGVKGPTDASNSPSFINPAKITKPDHAQQERRLKVSEEQHLTLELRFKRILEKSKVEDTYRTDYAANE